MIQTIRMADIMGMSVLDMASSEPSSSVLKCRSSVVKNFTLSLACAYSLASSLIEYLSSRTGANSATSKTWRMSCTTGRLNCSYAWASTACASRQYETSAIGPSPWRSTDRTRWNSDAMSWVHS